MVHEAWPGFYQLYIFINKTIFLEIQTKLYWLTQERICNEIKVTYLKTSLQR